MVALYQVNQHRTMAGILHGYGIKSVPIILSNRMSGASKYPIDVCRLSEFAVDGSTDDDSSEFSE